MISFPSPINPLNFQRCSGFSEFHGPSPEVRSQEAIVKLVYSDATRDACERADYNVPMALTQNSCCSRSDLELAEPVLFKTRLCWDSAFSCDQKLQFTHVKNLGVVNMVIWLVVWNIFFHILGIIAMLVYQRVHPMDILHTICLVGGLEHEFHFTIQLGMSSSQLTNSLHHFSEG